MPAVRKFQFDGRRQRESRPGSLGSYAGENLGIPTVPVELPAKASQFQTAELWERYGAMLLKSITYPPEIDSLSGLSSRRPQRASIP